MAQCDFFRWNQIVKELWEQATQAYNLPLTIGLIIFCIYWVVSSIGIFDFDADVEVEIDADAEVDLNGGFFGTIMNFVNAADVPVMLVLTVLNVCTWVISMISNEFWNPDHSIAIAAGLFIANFIISVILVKYLTKPLAPLFNAIKNDVEAAEPLIGQSGIVKSRVLDHNYGQVRVKRHNTSPALLNCRLSDTDQPLLRGDEVLIVSFDKDSKKYVVKSLSVEDATLASPLSSELPNQELNIDNQSEHLTTSE